MIHVTNDFKSLLPSCRWIKYLSPKTTKYIMKFWEIFVKRTSNLNYISVIKNSCFDQHFLGMYGSNHSTNSLVTIFVSMLRMSPDIYSATLLCKIFHIFRNIRVKHEIFQQRRIRRQVFYSKGVYNNFAKFTGKHLYQRLFLNKVAILLKKRL